MIMTVTLNPAVDKICRTERMIPGQVLRMKETESLAGGKGINVTKVLREYGQEVTALGFAGGYTGKYITDYVKKIGAEEAFIEVRGETRCSTNVLSEDGYVTELLEPGPVIDTESQNRFLELYESRAAACEYIVLSGSIPLGISEDIYGRLIEIGRAKGARVLLDTSGEALREGVRKVPYMVKPNRRELEWLSGRKLKDLNGMIHAALDLAELGIEHVLVSMGEKGMLYIRDKRILYARAPKIKAVNTIGCGDCSVASFVLSCLLQENMEQTLRQAVAVSAANAETTKIAVVDRERAEHLLTRINVEEY